MNNRTDMARNRLQRAVLRTAFAWILALSLPFALPAQTLQDSLRIYFPQGKSALDPEFENNGRNIRTFIDALKLLQQDTLLKVERLEIVASASPEGTVAKNEQLAYERAHAISDYLAGKVAFDRQALDITFSPVDWNLFAKQVRADGGVPYRDEVLACIGREDIPGLKTLRRGLPWNYLYKNVFPSLRQTFAVINFESDLPMPVLDDKVEVEELEWADLNTDFEPLDTWTWYVPLMKLDRGRSMYVKTNFLPWALLEANLGVEFEIGNHFSFELPFFYTALDWFNVQTKFRVLGTRPAFRYWFRDNFSGPFVGVHGTFGWYNVAMKSWEYRYQDRETRNPAYGAGIDLGWKFRLDPRGADRWGLEFGVGAGWLNLDYDLFYNVENGRYVKSMAKNYFGPDYATIALTYRITTRKARTL